MIKIDEKKLQERANQFRRDFLHTDQAAFARCLAPYAKFLPLLARTRISLPFSGHLLIGLTAAMEGATEGESPFWLFSKDFKNLSDEVAKGILSLTTSSTGEEPAAEIDGELFSKVIMGSLTALSGLLSLIASPHSATLSDESLDEKRDIPSESFYKALLIRSLLSSELIFEYLQQVAKGMGVNDKDLPWVSGALESLALLWAGLTLSEGVGSYDENFAEGVLESLSLKLSDRFEKLEERLQELVSRGKMTREKGQSLRLFLGQGHKTLASGEFKEFYKGLEEVGKPYGFELYKLLNDIQSAKRLFRVLETGFKASGQNKENAVLIIG